MLKITVLACFGFCVLWSSISLGNQKCMRLFQKPEQILETLIKIPHHYEASEAQIRKAFFDAVDGLWIERTPNFYPDLSLELLLPVLDSLSPVSQATILREIITWKTSNNQARRQFATHIERGFFATHTHFIRAIANGPLAEIVDVNFRFHHKTPLLMAAANNRLDLVEALLEVDGIDINAQNNYGSNLLMWIAERGHTQLLPKLPVDSMDINAQHISGSTAPMMAADRGYIEFLRYISNHPQLDLRVQDQRQRRLYERAQSSGYMNVIAFVRNLMIQKSLL